jgi:hypothetical protein
VHESGVLLVVSERKLRNTALKSIDRRAGRIELELFDVQ